MTREIKFRAWNRERMKEVLTWGFNEKFITTPKEVSPEKDFEVMQYTGLKDKNGKEIYEGDVCIHKQVAGGLLSPSKAKNVQIVWTELHNGWICDDGKYQYSMQTSQLEIIGNIYENPDLLSLDKLTDK